MASPSVTYTFVNGAVADASQVNQNFSDLVNALTDGSKSLLIDDLTTYGTLTITEDLVVSGGDVSFTAAATDIDLIDDNSSALSFDATGKAGILEIVTTNSSEGIKTSGRLTVSTIAGVGVAPSAAVAVNTYITSSNAGLTGVSCDILSTITSDVTAYIAGLSSTPTCNITAGKTNAGEINSIYTFTLRTLATDEGTLSVHRGFLTYVGHADTAATAAVTDNVYGISANISYGAGTINNAYGLFLNPYFTGGTVTNKWGIYENLGWDNYLKGKLGIGTTTPTSVLQAVGIAEHADNAAAILAGLTAGAVYRTGDDLKIVH